MSNKSIVRLTCIAALATLLSGCLPGGGGNIVPALKQLPAETQVLLAKSGMTQEAPIFVRIFKEESQLEVWKEKSDGRYHLFKTYPICTWSGDLGPKVREGDKQAPEGFYTVTPGQMNPNSQFHLAFNLGYPNAYDKANGRTGGALMVHGDCRSAGCFAMTDALIEEIYGLAREAFRGGQSKFHVHAFPFRMTEENMKRHRKSQWHGFWKTLKVGYDDFELTRKPPVVAVCSKQYLVNAEFMGHTATPDPRQNCPAYRRIPVEPFDPFAAGVVTANAPSIQNAASAARVASYTEPEQTPRPETTQGFAPQSNVQPSSDAPPADAGSSALMSSQPVRELTSQAIASKAEETGERQQQSESNADLREPDAALSLSQSREAAALNKTGVGLEAAGTEKVYSVAPITRGLHNVVESGKGDMIAPQNRLR